jgi:hypothetical protein
LDLDTSDESDHGGASATAAIASAGSSTGKRHERKDSPKKAGHKYPNAPQHHLSKAYPNPGGPTSEAAAAVRARRLYEALLREVG